MTGQRRLMLLIVVLLLTAVGLQVWRDRGWQPYVPASDVLWLQAGGASKRAMLGYDAIVADFYWIRSVVYFGRQRLSKESNKNYDLLYPFLDFVTTLDPRFNVAYRFGAIFLSERFPDGPERPDLAIKLLQHGIAENPTRWEYPHDIGFVHYFHTHDYQAAAEWFDRASKVPDSPYWLKSTAATTFAKGGDREGARLLWQRLYETAEADALKQNALQRIAQLDAADAIDLLNPIVWRYKAQTGRFPTNWNELVGAGVLRGVPADPAGKPFVLDGKDEAVKISEESPLWPLPAGMESYAR